MNKKKGTLVRAKYSFVLLLFFTPYLFSKKSIIPFDFSLSGYIKGEYYTDSRQTFDEQPDDVPFFPRRQLDDPTGQDINARWQTQMDAYETRVRLSMDGPEYRDFTIEGVVEFDFEIFFFDATNIPHMRHAFGKIQSKNANLLFGQTWHPVVFIEPQTINYNGNAPFDYYARSPQLTFTYQTPSRVEIVASALMQVDFASDGPYGFSNQYMRWATLPNFHLQVRWNFNNHMMGFGGDYKRLAPRIVSDTGYKVYERISSGAALWYLALKWPSVEIYTKINGGQNVSDYSGMGGYAVQQNSTNPVTGQRTYTNLNNIGGWTDITLTKNSKLQPGIFCAVSKNLGASKKIERDVVDSQGIVIKQNVFGFVNDVDMVFRVSPRFSGTIGSFILSGEVEYTRAYYGTITNMGKVVNTRPAELIRCTFASYYYF